MMCEQSPRAGQSQNQRAFSKLTPRRQPLSPRTNALTPWGPAERIRTRPSTSRRFAFVRAFSRPAEPIPLRADKLKLGDYQHASIHHVLEGL